MAEMTTDPRQPVDRHRKVVAVGSLVRIVNLSGDWFDRLSPDERIDVESMIGEVFTVEEIDEHGHPWVRKVWLNELEGTSHSHSVALEPGEMESVTDATN